MSTTTARRAGRPVVVVLASLLALAGCSSGTSGGDGAIATTAVIASSGSSPGSSTIKEPSSTVTRPPTTGTRATSSSTSSSTSLVESTTEAPPELQLEPISLDGFGALHLGMTADEFRTLTGVEPQTTAGNPEGLNCTTTSAELTSPRVRVRFNGDPLRIDVLSTDDPALATSTGVRVGDPVDTLTQAYPGLESSLGQRFLLFSDARDVAVLFADQNDAVVSISLLPADLIATDC